MVHHQPGSRIARRLRDRGEAGRELGQLLAHYRGDDKVIVLGLPRGGVPVAAEVARMLGAPLDVFVVRKLGLPGHEELAFGAIASGGVTVFNDSVLSFAPMSQAAIGAVVRTELRELERREKSFRGDRPPLDVQGKTVIIVDDGLATGATMRAAVEALRKMEPGRVIVAVPVAARETCEAFRDDPNVDAIVCARMPEPFRAVGLWYDEFEQTTDAEVHAALASAS